MKEHENENQKQDYGYEEYENEECENEECENEEYENEECECEYYIGDSLSMGNPYNFHNNYDDNIFPKPFYVYTNPHTDYKDKLNMDFHNQKCMCYYAISDQDNTN